jgi:hypothetical protein
MHGLTIDEIMVEEGVSGCLERPQGGLLFAKLKKGDAVIAPMLDRLFRSALDALTVVEDSRQRGVSCIFLTIAGGLPPLSLSISRKSWPARLSAAACCLERAFPLPPLILSAARRALPAC